MKTDYYESLKLEITKNEIESLVEEFRKLRLNSTWFRESYTGDNLRRLGRLEEIFKDYVKVL